MTYTIRWLDTDPEEPHDCRQEKPGGPWSSDPTRWHRFETRAEAEAELASIRAFAADYLYDASHYSICED